MTASHPSPVVIGLDVGGTFTDVFFLDESSGACEIAKVPSTTGDPSKGFVEVIRRHVEDMASVSTVVHGTTVGTNALLQRKGARTGIITTTGFRDALEMRRRDRPATWGLWGQFEPVVPRNLRMEVSERTLADGTIRMKVSPEEIRTAGRRMLARGAEAACIVFINAYANPANELAALAALRDVWPNPHIGASTDILPEIREFERTSTTALNAYLQPAIGSYLQNLETALEADGFNGQVLIVQSNGGVMTVEVARQIPIRTALSGPAAGVIASAYIAEEAGFPNIITCDMGGTSFDVSLVANGQTALAAQTDIDFGLTIRTPMIEITTIGAGGGSIACVDESGLLQVGPESAGSEPGPVCYGQGNEFPTVTDANVILGRINAEKPIGGKLDRLDFKGAEAAIGKCVGGPLGLETMEAAEAIIRVANSRMAGAIRLVSIERGHDPKNFSAMPFGGGGALHTAALIREIGLRSAIVPRYPGINSALGCTISDMRHDFVQTVNGMVDTLDIGDMEARLSALAEQGLARLGKAGVQFVQADIVFGMDMSYLGQTHTVDVALPLEYDDGRCGITRDVVLKAFETRYQEVFGRKLDGFPVRVLNLRVSAIGRRRKFDLALLAPEDRLPLESARSGTRRVWFDGRVHDTAIYDRLSLGVGVTVPGPAILEQADATICIEPGMEGRVDRFGNLIIETVERRR